jgi:beta-1,4-mannosyl-glycoprotein beta-1,4-N-acetylglucosaminyltransferase
MFIDTFLFNGDWITKLRLEYLYDFVDFFYIVESRYTFSGTRKETLFVETCAGWFEPYKNKVRIIVNEKSPLPNPWDEEKAQRDLVTHVVLGDAGDKEFSLAVCDCDELYDITKLPSKKDMLANKTEVIYPQMDIYYYRFTHRLELEHPWTMPFIIHSDLLQSEPSLNTIRVNKQIHDVSVKPLMIRSGWHFSFFLSIKDIQRKIRSFAHTEFNVPHITDTAEIERRIRDGLDVFSRVNLNIAIEPIADQFPSLFKKYNEELLEIQK